MRHATQIRTRDDGDAAALLRAPFVAPFPFDGAVASWNVEPEASSSVEIRLQEAAGGWTPWLRVGGWGAEPPRGEGRVRCDAGAVDVDAWKGARPCIALEARLLADPGVRLWRFAACFSAAGSGGAAAPAARTERLAVPFRSQHDLGAAIGPRACSPTSIAMVLEYRGVRVATEDVAARAFDRTHDLYGNWNRAVQTAFSFGIAGHVARFETWQQAEAAVRAGQPLVASIAVKDGALERAPYRDTAGHLVVITGFAERGDVCVNDPAARDAERGIVAYDREQFGRAWLDRGGLAYVLLPRT